MKIRSLLKKLIKRILHIKGFYLSRTRTGMDESLLNMSKLGLNPGTIIDVGVANGTYDLYEIFPKSKIMLIEPLKEFTPYLEEICSKYNAEYIIAAANDSCGKIKINVHPDLCGTSMLKEEEGLNVDGVERDIDAVTIDSIIDKYQLYGTYIIKIDVQGAELNVLNGAKMTLEQTDVVILEVSLHGFFKHGPQLYDVVTYMKNLGFVAYDIFDGRNRPLDGALAQVDIAFVKEQGWLRESKGYCTTEQREILTKNIRKKHTARI